MPDVSKHLEKAEKLVQKGKLEEAIQEYLQAWKEDPNNDAVVELVSELYLREGQTAKSLECYGYLFDKHRERSESAKAALVFRKMLKIGPQEPARLLQAGKLLEKLKPEEAAEHYRSASQILLEQGDKARALEALRPLASLEAGNVDLQFRLGEVAQDIGQKEMAAAAFFRAAELRRSQGEAQRALTLLERAHSLAPQDTRIAMGLASALFESGAAQRTIALLSVFGPGAPPEMLRLLAQAYLAVRDFSAAENTLGQLPASTPDTQAMLFRVAEGYLSVQQQPRAVELLERLKQAMFLVGRTREFVAAAQGLAQKEQAGTEVLEFLAAVYNELNDDSNLHGCLARLFDLYFAERNFLKASDTLDRMVDVDPYDAGNSRRLQRLSGKIDDRRWQVIAARFQQTATSSPSAAPRPDQEAAAGAAVPAGGAEAGEESNLLEDLMLQAEIFLQYGLKPRALERLERVNKLFPGEEERNDKLRSLYVQAGMQVRRAEGAAVAGGTAAADGARAGAEAEDASVDLARVSEITRNIYRQGTVKSVLFTAVNDVGRTWQVSKCLAGLCTPGKTPSAALEYCASGMKQSDVPSIVKLVTGGLQLVTDGAPLAVEDAESSPKLGALSAVVKGLGIQSLLVLPLMDAEQPIGVLLLEQCDRRRRWRSHEVMALKTIVDQVVMTATNVKLRSLMKSLSADERTGMLSRNSYIDCLLTEVGRAQKQNGKVCVLLMQFGRSHQLLREYGEEAVTRFIEEFSQAVAAHLRHSDVAIKYDSTTLAMVMADTRGQDALTVMEKMRRLLSNLRVSGKAPPPLASGIAEAILDSDMDPVDSVTELINRAEEALALASQEGGDKLLEQPVGVAVH